MPPSKKKKDLVSAALNRPKVVVNHKDVIFVEKFKEEQRSLTETEKSAKWMKPSLITLFICLIASTIILSVFYARLKHLMHRKDQMYSMPVPAFTLHEIANHTTDSVFEVWARQHPFKFDKLEFECLDDCKFKEVKGGEDKYLGQWKEGEREGRGALILSKGSMYEGYFRKS